jgi:uncharacterized protein YbcI
MMSILIPDETMQNNLEQQILQAWHEAHGMNKGQVSSSWGKDRVVVMIENALCKSETLLVQNKQGNDLLEQYVYKIAHYIINTHHQTFAQLLQQKLASISISMNLSEQWVMFIFRLAKQNTQTIST